MKHKSLKIVVTGPESTGKTELARHLGKYFRTGFIPEYARSHVEALDRQYTYADVEHIASVQENQLKEAVDSQQRVIILDTYLVITRIWFREVYGRIPDWVEQSLRDSDIDLFLLCYPDIEWIDDPVRENPGKKRLYLYGQYLEEIRQLGVPVESVKGKSADRFENAKKAILRHLPELKQEIL